MSPLARTWLRRIALGLPLASIVPLSGCSSVSTGGCPPPATRTEHFELDDATRAALAVDAGVGGVSPCYQVCTDLDRNRDGGAPPSLTSASCDVVVSDGGEVLACTFHTICRGGRPPAGLIAAQVGSTSAIGAFLASAAHLEAASVPAFLDLARELALHGAPRALRDAAIRSAVDELRHARAVGALAASAGAVTPEVVRRPTETRSLVAMAEDNAMHGCTGEAHAALVAAFQAEHASDPTLRAVWSGIARDEARHALLSASIHEHAVARLGARDARRIEDLRRDAIDSLARASEPETPREVRVAMSLPDAERAVELARALV